MASFRGVDQTEIVNSLNAFFDFLIDKNIGPLTNAAIASWRAPGGMLEQVANAPNAKAIEGALRGAGQGEQYRNFVFWMDCYFNSLLPGMEVALAKQKSADNTFETVLLRSLVRDVYAWGGFSLSQGRFHAMYPEDHEIKDYKLNVLKCTTDELFARYNSGAFKGPFQQYSALYAATPDFNAAAQAVKQLAADADMEDHVGYIGNDKGVELHITAKFAELLIDRAATIKDKNLAPVGLMQGGRFIPVKPAP